MSIIYVKWGATGTGDGSSWANAYTDLQDALAVAQIGDEVWVAAGTYTPHDNDPISSFTLPDQVRVYGGFDGTETLRTQRDWDQNVTTLSGDLGAGGQSYHVVDTGNTADGRVDGFVIEAGAAVGSGKDANGAGIYSERGHATLANLIIRNCRAQNLGGGLYSKDGALKLKNIVFQQCSAGSGGAMYTEKDNPEINDSIFVENTASARGGAIYFYDWALTNNTRNPRLINVKFERNEARDGASIYSYQSFFKINRSIFINNISSRYGGCVFLYLTYLTNYVEMANSLFDANEASDSGSSLYVERGDVRVINSTFHNNNEHANDVFTGLGFGKLLIANSILYNSSGDKVRIEGNPTIRFSLVQGGYPGSANFDDDPMFVAVTSGDFHLLSRSPAINKGNSEDVATTTDLDGSPRIFGGIVDVGAYENQEVVAAWLTSRQGAIEMAPARDLELPAKGHRNRNGKEGQDFAARRIILRCPEGSDSRELKRLRKKLGARRINRSPGLRCECWILLDPDWSVKKALRECRKRKWSHCVRAAAADDRIQQAADIPNDPSFDVQWYLRNVAQDVSGITGTRDADVDAPEAWNIARGAGVRIAVLDSGIFRDSAGNEHPDLAGKVLDGYDFVDHDSNPSVVENYHGTAVSGIIAALTDNDRGVASVAPDAEIEMYRIFDRHGQGSTFEAIQAIEMADRGDLKIINCSWGTHSYNDVLYDVIADRPDILFVCAAGNYGNDMDLGLFPFYPAAFDLDNIVSVAASDSHDGLAGFSNYGFTTTDLAAPGVVIYTTSIDLLGGPGYAYANGTSFAAPIVAAIGALILSQNPGWTALQVKQRILDSVDPIAALNGLVATGGRVNAFQALGGREDADIALWARSGSSETVGREFGGQPTEGQYQTLIATGPGSVSSSEIETFLGLSAGDLNNLIGGNATEGSAIELEVEVDAGATIRIDWKFLTNEHTPGPHNDSCFLSIRGESLRKLAATDSDFVPSPTLTFARETAQGTFQHQFATAGTYKVGLGVVDEGDTSVHSGLLVDNPLVQPAESAVA